MQQSGDKKYMQITRQIKLASRLSKVQYFEFQVKLFY